MSEFDPNALSIVPVIANPATAVLNAAPVSTPAAIESLPRMAYPSNFADLSFIYRIRTSHKRNSGT
jgi:hypothetical protein